MITLLTIILVITISLIVITKLIKKQERIELIEKFNLIRRKRLLSYFLFVVTSLILPFIVTIFSIMITGSREDGMALGFRIPFFLINFGFAFIIIKSKIIKQLLSGLIISIVTLGLMWTIMYSKILESTIFENSNSYGIWRLIFLFIIISLTSWEITYRIMNKNYEC